MFAATRSFNNINISASKLPILGVGCIQYYSVDLLISTFIDITSPPRSHNKLMLMETSKNKHAPARRHQ